MGEATLYKNAPEVCIAADGAVASGEILQAPDGRAGIYTGLRGAEAGDAINLALAGQYKVKAASAKVFAVGKGAFWDKSENTAIESSDEGYNAEEDFYLGIVVAAKAALQTDVLVDLNVALPLN